MKKTLLLLGAGLLGLGLLVNQGCGGGSKGPGIKIATMTPADGATDVAGGTNILVGFVKDDGTTTDLTVEGTVSLTDDSGNEIPGDLTIPYDVEVQVGSKTVKYPGFKFDPFGPELPFSNTERLKPSTHYNLSVTYNGKTETFGFTTSAFGTPLTVDPATLKTSTYILDLAKATVEEPPKLFDFVQQLVSDFVLPPMLLNVHDINNPPGKVRFAGAIACIGGTGDSSWCAANAKPFGAQDESSPAVAFPLANFSDPFFTFGPQDFGLIVAGEELQILQLVVGGIFASDGNSLGEGVLQGIIDVKGVAAALGDVSYADLACQILPSITGRSCKPCPAPLNYSYCIDLKLTNIPNTKATDQFKNIIAPVVVATLNGTNADVTVKFSDLDEQPRALETIDINLSGPTDANPNFVVVPSGCSGTGLTRTCTTDANGTITGIQITGTAGKEVTIKANPTSTPPSGYTYISGEAAVTF